MLDIQQEIQEVVLKDYVHKIIFHNMKQYGELLKLSLSELSEIFSDIIKKADIASFINIHDNGE